MRTGSLLLCGLVLVASAGCTSGQPKLTPQQAFYEQCVAQGRAEFEKAVAEYKSKGGSFQLRFPIVSCAERRDHIARSVGPEYYPYQPSSSSSDLLWIKNEPRRMRQERFNHCLSGAVLPFHCQY